jgi:two-component system, cell cycle response regulator DivK
MTFPFDSGQFDRISHHARRLEARTASHEIEIEAFLATTEADERLGHAALARPRKVTQECVDQLATALLAQVHRSEERVETVRQLCVAARETRLAAGSLASELDGPSDQAMICSGSMRHAVLVVDDYEDTRELVSTVLHGAGFIVRTASNGLEAILAAYELRPAVILMDVSMPVLDGVEATRLIKTIDAIRDARVIAHTARPTFSALTASTLFAAVLPKPALPDVVLATVRQCMSA